MVHGESKSLFWLLGAGYFSFDRRFGFFVGSVRSEHRAWAGVRPHLVKRAGSGCVGACLRFVVSC